MPGTIHLYQQLDFICEAVNWAADAWLRDMEFQHGPGNIFLHSDGNEVADMAQFHFREHSQKLSSGTKHWYFFVVLSLGYGLVMMNLIEVKKPSEDEDGKPVSKKHDEKIQVGVDSFAAALPDDGKGV